MEVESGEESGVGESGSETGVKGGMEEDGGGRGDGEEGGMVEKKGVGWKRKRIGKAVVLEGTR